MAAELIPIIIVFILFIGLPWLVLHYVARMRESRGLSQDDERMLEDLWRSAREISRRLETVEDILEITPERADRQARRAGPEHTERTPDDER